MRAAYTCGVCARAFAVFVLLGVVSVGGGVLFVLVIVCLRVCVCLLGRQDTYVCVCPLCMRTHALASTCARVRRQTHTHSLSLSHTHTYTHTHTHTHTHMSVGVFTYISVACIYVSIHTHTLASYRVKVKLSSQNSCSEYPPPSYPPLLRRY
jgi:hypothetical protein